MPTPKVEVRYTPRAPQREIHAALDAHRFCVIVAHRRLGKTVCALHHLIKRAACTTRTDGKYAYVGPLLKQTKAIAWKYLKQFTSPFDVRNDAGDLVLQRKVNESELSVTLPNGSEIRLHGADNPDALRGIYLDGVVMDEVAQMKPEVWGEIVRPTLSDRQGFAMFIGTPKGMNLFHELYQRSLTAPGWFGGIWRVDQTGIIPEAELESIRQDLSTSQYRQEFLCDFSASADDVLIPLDLVDESARRTILTRDVEGSERVLGIDVARFGDDSTVFTRRHGLYMYPQSIYHGLANDEVADRAVRAINDFRPDAVFIDAGGQGAGVVDILRRWQYDVTGVDFGAKPRRDKVYYNKRAEMWGDLRDWLLRGGRIPDDPDLKTDMTQPQYWFTDNGSKIQLESKKAIKARGGRSPDRGDSAALTFATPVLPRSEIMMTHSASHRSGHGDDDYDPLG